MPRSSLASARLPTTVHTTRPWRIHDVVRDFHLEDVWALPTPGAAGDFPRLVHDLSRMLAGAGRQSRVVGALFGIRWAIARLLGWDRPDTGLDLGVRSLRERLSAELRDAPSDPVRPQFTSLYLLDDEWAAEIANRTVHGVIHVGWVPDERGRYRREMAVYATMLRHVERAWDEMSRGEAR